MALVDVLLLVDNKMRDGLNVGLVAERLKASGVSTWVCNKRNVIQFHKLLKPKVIVLSYTKGKWISDHIPEISKISKIVVLPQEGAIPERDKGGIEGYRGELSQYVHKYLLWGQKTKELIEKSSDVDIPPEKMVVTSTTKLDPYWMKISQEKIPIEASGVRNTQRIGFALTGTYFLNNYQKPGMLDVIMTRRGRNKCGYRNSRYYEFSRGRDIEDHLWVVSAIMRAAFDIMDLLIERGWHVSIRPGMFEDFHMYRKLFPDKKKVSISTGEYLHEWLSGLDILMCGHTSVGIDSILASVPVIYWYDLLDTDRLFEHCELPNLTKSFFSELYWRPKTHDEIIEKIEEGLKGDLLPTPEPERYLTYLKDYYDVPRSEVPSVSIAREITELL